MSPGEGQLSNIFQIKDQTTTRHALLQVILAMKDVTSRARTAVGGEAWATSMHDLDKHHLGSSLNHLSASQISMVTSQIYQPPQHKKLCKFFNKGSCSHEPSHGQYKHVCVFCDRQGKVGNHPKQKCFSKTRTNDRTTLTTSGQQHHG